MTNEELQMKINHIEGEISEVKQKVSNLPTREEMQRDNERLVQDVIKECDRKYASKWTEKAIYYLVFSVVVGYIIIQFLQL